MGFVRKYYLPLCPKWDFSTHGKRPIAGGRVFDFERYEREREITDEEFRDLHNSRDAKACAPTDVAHAAPADESGGKAGDA